MGMHYVQAKITKKRSGSQTSWNLFDRFELQCKNNYTNCTLYFDGTVPIPMSHGVKNTTDLTSAKPGKLEFNPCWRICSSLP